MTNTERAYSLPKNRNSLCMLMLSCLLFNVGCMKQINKNLTDLEAKDSYYRGDFGRSFRLTEALAYQGDAKAEYTLGYMYYYGIGAPANKPLGKAWIRRSAEQGYNPALIAAEQIDICDSRVTPKRAKKCLDTSREIAPFEQHSLKTETLQQVTLAPRLDAEIVPASETTEMVPVAAATEEVKEAENIPSIPQDAVLLTNEMNIALHSADATERFEAKDSWVVQIATFKNPKNAEALVEKLNAAGHPAFTRSGKAKNKPVTLVMMGPNEKKTEAKQLCADLAMHFQLQGMVLRDSKTIEQHSMVSYLSFVDTPLMIRFH